MEAEYVPRSVNLPISILEIALFITAFVLLFGTGELWHLWLGSFLLLFVICSLASRFWPPPKFELPATPLMSKRVPREDITKPNFVWHPKYRVRFWLHIFPARKYGLIYDRAIEEEILTKDDFIQHAPLDDDDLRLVHGRGYLWSTSTWSGQINILKYQH